MFRGANEVLLGVIECIFPFIDSILRENEYLFRLNDQQKVYLPLSHLWFMNLWQYL